MKIIARIVTGLLFLISFSELIVTKDAIFLTSYSHSFLNFLIDSRNWTLLHPGEQYSQQDGSGDMKMAVRSQDLPVDIDPTDPQQTTIPWGRGDHSAVEMNGGMVVFGGSSNNLFLNDVWFFDLHDLTWTRLHDGNGNAVPGPRSDHGSL